LFHADRRRDKRTVMTELIVAFRNFAKAPRNCTVVGRPVTFILGVPLPLQPETYRRGRSYGDEGGGGEGGMLERRKQFPAVEKQKRRKLYHLPTPHVRYAFVRCFYFAEFVTKNKRQ